MYIYVHTSPYECTYVPPLEYVLSHPPAWTSKSKLKRGHCSGRGSHQFWYWSQKCIWQVCDRTLIISWWKCFKNYVKSLIASEEHFYVRHATHLNNSTQVCFSVCKLQEFFVIHILREIKIGECSVSNSTTFTHLGALDFNFMNFALFQGKDFPNYVNSEPLNLQ